MQTFECVATYEETLIITPPCARWRATIGVATLLSPHIAAFIQILLLVKEGVVLLLLPHNFVDDVYIGVITVCGVIWASFLLRDTSVVGRWGRCCTIHSMVYIGVIAVLWRR